MDIMVVASEMMFWVRVWMVSRDSRRERKSERRVESLFVGEVGEGEGMLEGARIVERISVSITL